MPGITSLAAKGAIAVALFAAVLKSVALVKPTLFLLIPNVGFIFHTILTGQAPPPYFTYDAWEPEEARTWLKDGDVVVATGAKSGTTWMLYCTHQIRTKGAADADELFEDISIGTPWPELLQDADMTWAKQKELLNTTILPSGVPLKEKWDNARYPFRVWKSHATPQTLPIKEFPNVKFISMTRNGIDVLSSMIPFFNSHSDEFRKMWGGFPPADTGSMEDNAAKRLAELMPGGMLESIYFGYVKAWWPSRNEPNVFLSHYADAVKDLRGHVTKLSKFVGVDLNKEELDTVVERCGMPHMKKNAHMFKYRLPLSDKWSSANIMELGAMTRKGGVGTGKADFTDEQKAAWAKAEEEMLGDDPALLKYAREGGTFIK